MPDPIKTPLEAELDDRTVKARAKFEQSHTELFKPAADAVVEDPPAPLTGSEPLIVAEPPAEIPALEAIVDDTAPAVVEEPPAEPRPQKVVEKAAADPAEVKPVEPEVPKNEAFPWKEFKQMQRELRKLAKEKEAAPAAPAVEAKPATAPVAEAADDDPFGVKAAARAEGDAIRAEMAVNQQKADERALANELEMQESQFRQVHPDYNDAIQHMVQMEQNRYRRSGRAMVDGNRLLNDPRMARAIETVADNYVAVPNQNGGVNYLERAKVPAAQLMTAREITDSEAAQAIATDLWIAGRRNDIISGAKAQGKQVPEIVWELATEVMGYQPKGAAATVPVVAKPGAPAPAAQRTVAEDLRARARAATAGKSLSSVNGGAPDIAATPQITTLRELMQLRNTDHAAFLAYSDMMTKTKGPSWHRNLAP